MEGRYLRNRTLPETDTSGNTWEDLRKQARKTQTELDGLLAKYGKIFQGGEQHGGYGYSRAALMADEQTLQRVGGEIEALLERLGRTNAAMEATLQPGDTRRHTMERHVDIFNEYNQEYRRLSTSARTARERAELLSGSEAAPLLGLSVEQASQQQLLHRERNQIQTSIQAIDDVIAHASAVNTAVTDQGHLFRSINHKVVQVAQRFPVVSSLLNAIRRKKQKDTLIVGGVTGICIIFLLVYILYR